MNRTSLKYFPVIDSFYFESCLPYFQMLWLCLCHSPPPCKHYSTLGPLKVATLSGCPGSLPGSTLLPLLLSHWAFALPQVCHLESQHSIGIAVYSLHPCFLLSFCRGGLLHLCTPRNLGIYDQLPPPFPGTLLVTCLSGSHHGLTCLSGSHHGCGEQTYSTTYKKKIT